MDQNTPSGKPLGGPKSGFSGYKIAALVLAITAVLIIAGAVLIPRITSPSKSNVGATATPETSATASKTAVKNSNASAVSTGSSATGVSSRSQDNSGEISATPGSNTGGGASCGAYDYGMDESQCASQTPERVCGTIRYVYDNGEEATRPSTFTNVCEYCSQFDANGFLELRGTKMYSKGYSMGQCQ